MLIEVLLNGKQASVRQGIRLQELLQERSIQAEQVALAVNGEIIQRDVWGEYALKSGDEVEIVRVMAGGSPTGRFQVAEKAAAEDPLVIAGRTFHSRLMLGTGKYANFDIMRQSFEASNTEIVTVAIRYMNLEKPEESILNYIDRERYWLLPNTAGATTAEHAVRMAELARAATGTNWIKLEVIGDSQTLWPDTTATVEATRELVKRGFVVLPYTSPDLVVALQLEDAGAATVMPLGAPIGSGQGMIDWTSIQRIIERVKVPVVVDAGLGVPSDAAQALEMGAAAVLVNTAVAEAGDPVKMAAGMALAVEAGRLSYRAGRMPKRPHAAPSSPEEGVPVAKPAGMGRSE